MGCPCETRTSTCRSFATISSGLYRFLAITVLLDVKDIPQVGPLQWGRIRVVLARREHVIALEPKGRGLVGTTLRYPYEVRDEKPYFEDIPELKLPKEMLDLAAHIVQTKSGHFDPSQFEDR